MSFSAETTAFYRMLFEEANAALQKEANVTSRPGMLARLFAGKHLTKADEALAAASSKYDDLARTTAHELDQARHGELLAARQAERAERELIEMGHRPGALSEAQQAAQHATQQTQRATRGRNLALGLGATGLGVGVPGAYALGRSQQTADRTKARNLAFGAGAAAGLAAPQVIKGLGNIARGQGAFPLGGQGEYY